MQAALTGQGLALARMPLIADSLASGDLVEVLPGYRLDSPLVYWMLVGPRSGQRPEIKAFCSWLLREAQLTREAVGEVPRSGPERRPGLNRHRPQGRGRRVNPA